MLDLKDKIREYILMVMMIEDSMAREVGSIIIGVKDRGDQRKLYATQYY